MSRLRKAYESNFTQIHNDAVTDTRLTWKARGVLLYLWSRPDDWAFKVERIAQEASDGIHALRSALKELEACGYLTRTPAQGNGGVFAGMDWVITDRPEHQPETNKVKPTRDRRAGFPSDGKTVLRNNRPTGFSYDTTNKDSTKTDFTKTEAAAARAEEIENDSGAYSFLQVAQGKPNPHHERARVRSALRRLAGTKFTERFETHLTAWTRWTNTDLERLWTASDLTHWPDEREMGKRRSFIFEDLLNEDRTPPTPETKRRDLKDITAPLYAAMEAAKRGDVEAVDALLN